MYLLSLNLKFCLTTKPLNDIEILNDFNNFARLVRIKFYFNVNNANMNYHDSKEYKYKLKNNLFSPPLASNIVESYLYNVQNNLSSMLLRHPIENYKPSKYNIIINNLIKQCNLLKKIYNILFIPSDKNLGITIVYKSWYLKECYRHLNDTNTYRLLSSSPDIPFVFEQLKCILNKYNVNQNSTLFKYLMQNVNSYKIAKFKLIIKIHKTPITGRPIVNNISSPTYYTSKHLHDLLFPLLYLIPSYIQDSNVLVLKLNNLRLPDNAYLFTADVDSLYPSIPIQIAITYVKRFLIRFKEYHNLNIEYILELLFWVLNNNFIYFNNNFYLQILGIAMGTPVAVVLSNIFLGVLEFDIYDSLISNHFYPPFMLYRYIDDLFGIFYDNLSRDKFIYLYNNSINTIKLTHNIDNDKQIFLDLCIFKGKNYENSKILDIKLYQKPLNKYLYIPPHSFHTSHMFKGFILSNFNRIRF